MGIQDTRLLQWAANQYYAAGVGPHRTGTALTKVEPSAGEYAEGFAADVDVQAEKINWLMNQGDSLRSGLLLARLSMMTRQIFITGSQQGATYPGNTVETDYQGSGLMNFEVMSGAFSRRRRVFVNLSGSDGAFIAYRTPDGFLRSTATLGTGHSGAWARGTYLYGAGYSTSFAVMLNVGAATNTTNAAIAFRDDETPPMTFTATASAWIVYNENPVAVSSTGLVYYLATLSGVIGVGLLSPGVGSTGSNLIVSTGLATTSDGFYQLHRLSSGRMWVTTSRRAAYSDDNGATWNFDGAAAGTSQGEACVYDETNARWIRFSRGTGTPYSTAVRIAANANNPTASTALKTILQLYLFSAPIVWGRFVFAVAGLSYDFASAARVKVVFSSDYGLTWLETDRHFTNVASAEGTIGAPLMGPTNVRISHTPFGVCARATSSTGYDRLILSVPMPDPNSETVYT